MSDCRVLRTHRPIRAFQGNEELLLLTPLQQPMVTFSRRFNFILAPLPTGPDDGFSPSLGLFKLLSTHKSKETRHFTLERVGEREEPIAVSSEQIRLSLYQRRRQAVICLIERAEGGRQERGGIRDRSNFPEVNYMLAHSSQLHITGGGLENHSVLFISSKDFNFLVSFLDLGGV